MGFSLRSQWAAEQLLRAAPRPWPVCINGDCGRSWGDKRQVGKTEGLKEQLEGIHVCFGRTGGT